MATTNKGGRLAANFRRANIAEGLAIQMFRPFAAVSAVPREEDYGIDFIGTLIRRQGMAFVAEDTFIVQVKTATSPVFSFAGEGVGWLTNLKLPYFPVIADLNKGKISVYTLNKFLYVLFASRVIHYDFVVQNEYCEGDSNDDFPLDDPIMEWNLADCTHENFAAWAYFILKPFIIIEARNFQYGKLKRFEMFDVSTFTFDSNIVTAESPIIETRVLNVPPGDGNQIESILKSTMGPFANWIANQVYNQDKSQYLLDLRSSLRGLGFDPDPENEWDEIAADMISKFK